MAFYFSPFPFASVLSFSFSTHLLSIFFLYRSLPNFNKNAPFSLSGWITFFICSIFLQVLSLLLLLLRFPSLTCHLAHQVMLRAVQLPSFLPSIRKVCRMPFVQGSQFSCLGCNVYFRCCLFTPARKDDEKWCLARLTCRMSHPHT